MQTETKSNLIKAALMALTVLAVIMVYRAWRHARRDAALAELDAFIAARQSNSCSLQLGLLDGAKQQWALTNKKTDTETPSLNDLIGTDKYLRYSPTCPLGGVYTLGNVSERPACSKHGTNF